MLIRAFLRGNDLKAFLFHQSAFLHFLVYATKSKRLPQPLETQNKSIILLFFAFLGVILFKKMFGPLLLKGQMIIKNGTYWQTVVRVLPVLST